MPGLLRAGAAFFIIVGLFAIILSMLLPVVLAFGLGIGQGLAFVFGGLLLLALTQLISAVERVAVAMSKSVHAAMPADAGAGRHEPPAAAPAAAAQRSAPQPEPEARQQPAAQQQQQKRQEQQPVQPQQQQKQQEQQPAAQQQSAQPQQQQKQPEQKPAAQQQQQKPTAQQQEQKQQQQKPQEQDEEVAEPVLHIVEERVIRGRPARILSDGTIEAELDEGWFRFENMEHLNEYLDALEELRQQGMV